MSKHREERISIVLPCFRSGSMVLDTARQLEAVLKQHSLQYELIVVDDGGHDIPAEVTSANIRVVKLQSNRGKGAAVREGMLAATGDVRVFTDVDLPYGAEIIPVMVRYLRHLRYHVVIGDRTLPASVYAEELRVGRRAASALFSAVVGRLVTGGFFDTQCGLKAFRGDVADELFSITHIDRFAFDVELVYICLKHRLDIKRIPVRLSNNQTSTVRLLRDSLRGCADILRIKLFQLRGAYSNPRLEQLVSADYDAVYSESIALP